MPESMKLLSGAVTLWQVN